MPELPEVQTTVDGLRSKILGLTITDVWSDYNSPFYIGKDSIKDPSYFKKFKKQIIGKKIIAITRRAKNILVHLSSGDIILLHMKMTGHILYGRFIFNKKTLKIPDDKAVWTPAPDERIAFHDPFNRFIHFVMIFSKNGPTGKEPVLVLSDMRKFAKITLIKEKDISTSLHLDNIGPDALDTQFTFKQFKSRLNLRPHGKIKTVLMDQSILAGVGNIYSDEALWRASIHPEEHIENIPDPILKDLFIATRKVLEKGIDFGGDSMSDYRNIYGERGKFQEQHNAYRKTGSRCTFKPKYLQGDDQKNKKDGHICPGIILRKVVGGRSAHFCSVHQHLQNARRPALLSQTKEKNSSSD